MTSARSKPIILSALVLSVSVFASSATAQPKVTREVEANGSIFFGNTSQRLASMRAGISRADSAFEISLGAGFTYADVEDAAGVRAVNRRSWTGNTALDWRPYATVSPFLFATVESSLEKQIDMRWGAGAGAKWVIHRDTVHLHDFSLAVLGEKTTPRVPTPDFNDELLARWSARYRVKGKLSSGVSYSSTTLYKPALSDMGDYSISSVNSLGIALNTSLALTFTFIDNYDSQARVRGAAENNDGQLLFGLKATW